MHPAVSPGRILANQLAPRSDETASRPWLSAEQTRSPAHGSTQDGIRPDEKPELVQDLARQRCQERGKKGPVLWGESHPGVGAELPLKDGDLVAQGENLDLLVPIAHRQQPQRAEGVGNGEIG
ncbi:hypothetical protein ACFSKW_51055 [Nonomuraea mangrovi]|uniref:Uncharacterized protein n=1 Tax=Nonomuraea mangrovi TaxID=2316207 RepID=A0ABW4TF69_9ACTN